MSSSEIVLVTGASSGIGEATAKLLREQGFTVYAAARRIEKMKHLEEAGARILKMDLEDDSSMIAGIGKIVADCGRIDHLVNCAGYGSYGALEEVPISEGRRQMEVNVFGLARLTQLVIPHMRSQQSGRIINISSIGGKVCSPLGSWYHASKFALEGLSDSLRVELRSFNIKVILIEPGSIQTDWGRIAGKSLLANSGNGPYGKWAHGMATRTIATSDDGRGTSPPSVIATTILKSIQQKKPKTRYLAGKLAGTLYLLRRILPDSALDRLIARMILK